MSYPDFRRPKGRRLKAPLSGLIPTVPVEETGGHGSPLFEQLARSYYGSATMAQVMAIKAGADRYRCHPVPGVDPVDGWVLMTFDEDDGDGFSAPAYVARSIERDVLLDVSRFRFSPTQPRFAWLVRNGFPPRPNPFGAWDDTDIDYRICEGGFAL